MFASKTELLDAARSLPVADRRDLIDALIQSLPEEAEIRKEWIAECRARLAAYDRGDTIAVPLTDVFPELARTAASS